MKSIRTLSLCFLLLLQWSECFYAASSRDTKKVGDNTWLVDAGDDMLMAHAILTFPPYNADPTGRRDSTQAFNKAIAAVGHMGGGLIYVPAGEYRVDGTILVRPDKVVIQGPGTGKPTTLLAYSGKGEETGTPFITIKGKSCGLKNLGIYYPEQKTESFTPYPYTIDSAPSVLLENITLYNAYQGISFGHINGVVLEDIRMCALKKGIVARYSSEFGWSREIEVSASVWRDLPSSVKGKRPSIDKIQSYMKANCVAMELGALDGFVVDGLAAADCKTALWVRKDMDFIRSYHNGAESRRSGDNFGLGAILSRIKGKIVYNDHDYYYWGIPASNLDNVKDLPKLRQDWPLHRRAARTSAKDIFSVKAYGAKGDGKADDTRAIQAALKNAAQNRGGIVYLPQGQYRITRPLQVPAGTELRGACARQELRLGSREVTSLLFETGANPKDPKTATASITLGKNAGLRGLNVLYPEQWTYLTEAGFKPVPYPYAVRGTGRGVYLIDCVITPAWQMVDFASHRCDAFMIKRVAGWGMKTGLHIGGGSQSGTIEFTQITYGLTLGTDRNPLVKMKDGWGRSFKILSDYSGKSTIPYLFGDAANLECYGLQAFHPLKHIETYRQSGKSLRDTRFYYPVLDVSLEQSLVMDGAENLDFYGYWVTGRNRQFNWVKGSNIKNIRVFAPGIQPTYHRGNYEESVPLKQFSLIPETALPAGTRIVEGGADARNLLDGDLRTAWTVPLKTARVVLDLTRAMTVHRYTLVDGHLAKFKNTTAIKEYRISVSLDKKTWTPLEIPETTFMKHGFKNPQKFVVLDQPVIPTKARYIKLELLATWKTNRKAPDTRAVSLRLFDVHTED